jgi:transposase
MQPLYVGLDIDRKNIEISCVDQTGNLISKHLSVPNDASGAETMAEHIKHLMDQGNYSDVVVGLESTSVYGFHIQRFLSCCPQLKVPVSSIIVFPPKLISRFRDSMNVAHRKNDKVDSVTIAYKLRSGPMPNSNVMSPEVLALQRLTRYRFHLMQSLCREKCYCSSIVFLKFSGLCQQEVFSDNFGTTALQVLTEFMTLDDIAARPLDDLVELLNKYGKNHFSDPEATAVALKQAAQISYRLEPPIDQAVDRVFKTCADNIRYLEQHLKSLDKLIEKELIAFKNEATCLTSVPGVGPVTSAGIIAEIGDIKRFNSESSLAKYAGLTWSEHQSGDFTAEDTKLQRAGNTYLRYYLIQAVDQMRKRIPEYQEYYARKFSETRTHKHHRALVLSARKAVRLFFHLLREEQLYSPTRKGDDI